MCVQGYFQVGVLHDTAVVGGWTIMNGNVNSFIVQNHSTLAHSDSGRCRTAYCPFTKEIHQTGNQQGVFSVAVAVTPAWCQMSGRADEMGAESDCKSAPREGLLALVEVESPTDAAAMILTTLPVHSPHRVGAAGHSSCGHSTNPVGGGDTAQKKQQLHHVNVNTGKVAGHLERKWIV